MSATGEVADRAELVLRITSVTAQIARGNWRDTEHLWEALRLSVLDDEDAQTITDHDALVALCARAR